jgi:CDP-diacylglycerol--glycerol-3-phosphate 3-phosphatidyltransferase
VSVARVLLVPVMVLLLVDGGRGAAYIAAAVFAVGALTDGVDGYLARRYESVTRTGQWLDPLADKLLVSAAAITLAILDRFPMWAAVAIVVRELGLVALRIYAGLRGRPMPASRAAKLKTVVQLAAITLYILPLGTGADGIRLGVLIAAVVLTVATGLDYLVGAVRAERRPAGGRR